MKAFVVEKTSDNTFEGSVKEIPIPQCEENEVLIKVEYSSINYKDALSSIGNVGVSRNFPHITGIDLAGTIHESKSQKFKKNQRVVVTGYDLGMNTKGGHAQFVKVPDTWVAKIPENLNSKEIMTYGTAGLTAALSVNELIKNNIKPSDGNILVSGSSGGVGSIAIAILSKLGYEVSAISSKKNKEDYLKSIGASEVILLEDFLKNKHKPLDKPKYAGIVDTLGGEVLSSALKSLKYDGVATCCGLASSSELNTNVFPFILRGVRLIGIDSVECALDKKQEIWNKLANEWKLNNLDDIAKEISLKNVKETYKLLLKGQASGRYVLRLN